MSSVRRATRVVNPPRDRYQEALDRDEETSRRAAEAKEAATRKKKAEAEEAARQRKARDGEADRLRREEDAAFLQEVEARTARIAQEARAAREAYRVAREAEREAVRKAEREAREAARDEGREQKRVEKNARRAETRARQHLVDEVRIKNEIAEVEAELQRPGCKGLTKGQWQIIQDYHTVSPLLGRAMLYFSRIHPALLVHPDTDWAQDEGEVLSFIKSQTPTIEEQEAMNKEYQEKVMLVPPLASCSSCDTVSPKDKFVSLPLLHLPPSFYLPESERLWFKAERDRIAALLRDPAFWESKGTTRHGIHVINVSGMDIPEALAGHVDEGHLFSYLRPSSIISINDVEHALLCPACRTAPGAFSIANGYDIGSLSEVDGFPVFRDLTTLEKIILSPVHQSGPRLFCLTYTPEGGTAQRAKISGHVASMPANLDAKSLSSLLALTPAEFIAAQIQVVVLSASGSPLPAKRDLLSQIPSLFRIDPSRILRCLCTLQAYHGSDWSPTIIIPDLDELQGKFNAVLAHVADNLVVVQDKDHFEQTLARRADVADARADHPTNARGGPEAPPPPPHQHPPHPHAGPGVDPAVDPRAGPGVDPVVEVDHVVLPAPLRANDPQASSAARVLSVLTPKGKGLQRSPLLNEYTQVSSLLKGFPALFPLPFRCTDLALSSAYLNHLLSVGTRFHDIQFVAWLADFKRRNEVNVALAASVRGNPTSFRILGDLLQMEGFEEQLKKAIAAPDSEEARLLNAALSRLLAPPRGLTSDFTEEHSRAIRAMMRDPLRVNPASVFATFSPPNSWALKEIATHMFIDNKTPSPTVDDVLRLPHEQRQAIMNADPIGSALYYNRVIDQGLLKILCKLDHHNRATTLMSLRGTGALGSAGSVFWVTELQSRGLPHGHLMFSLAIGPHALEDLAVSERASAALASYLAFVSSAMIPSEVRKANEDKKLSFAELKEASIKGEAPPVVAALAQAVQDPVREDPDPTPSNTNKWFFWLAACLHILILVHVHTLTCVKGFIPHCRLGFARPAVTVVQALAGACAVARTGTGYLLTPLTAAARACMTAARKRWKKDGHLWRVPPASPLLYPTARDETNKYTVETCLFLLCVMGLHINIQVIPSLDSLAALTMYMTKYITKFSPSTLTTSTLGALMIALARQKMRPSVADNADDSVRKGQHAVAIMTNMASGSVERSLAESALSLAGVPSAVTSFTPWLVFTADFILHARKTWRNEAPLVPPEAPAEAMTTPPAPGDDGAAGQGDDDDDDDDPEYNNEERHPPARPGAPGQQATATSVAALLEKLQDSQNAGGDGHATIRGTARSAVVVSALEDYLHGPPQLTGVLSPFEFSLLVGHEPSAKQGGAEAEDAPADGDAGAAEGGAGAEEAAVAPEGGLGAPAVKRRTPNGRFSYLTIHPASKTHCAYLLSKIREPLFERAGAPPCPAALPPRPPDGEVEALASWEMLRTTWQEQMSEFALFFVTMMCPWTSPDRRPKYEPTYDGLCRWIAERNTVQASLLQRAEFHYCRRLFCPTDDLAGKIATGFARSTPDLWATVGKPTASRPVDPSRARAFGHRAGIEDEDDDDDAAAAADAAVTPMTDLEAAQLLGELATKCAESGSRVEQERAAIRISAERLGTILAQDYGPPAGHNPATNKHANVISKDFFSSNTTREAIISAIDAIRVYAPTAKPVKPGILPFFFFFFLRAHFFNFPSFSQSLRAQLLAKTELKKPPWMSTRKFKRSGTISTPPRRSPLTRSWTWSATPTLPLTPPLTSSCAPRPGTARPTS